MLHPAYGEGVEDVLDLIENDEKKIPLWNEIVRGINLICDEPDSALARRYAINLTELDFTVWRVPLRVPFEDQNWCILWSPQGDEAVILYVGQWPPSS